MKQRLSWNVGGINDKTKGIDTNSVLKSDMPEGILNWQFCILGCHLVQ